MSTRYTMTMLAPAGPTMFQPSEKWDRDDIIKFLQTQFEFNRLMPLKIEITCDNGVIVTYERIK